MIKIIEGYGFTHDRYGYSLFEIGEHDGIDRKTRQKTGCQTLADFVMLMEQIKNEIISALKDTAI